MRGEFPIFHIRTPPRGAGRAAPGLELKPEAVFRAAHPGSPSPTPASEEGSESEGSESSGRSCRNERSVQEKLQVLAAEGLLPAVKVFLDWLRANPDLIVVCAQVRLSGAAGAAGGPLRGFRHDRR